MPVVYFKPLLQGAANPGKIIRAKLLHRLGQLAIQEIKKEIDRTRMDHKRDIKKQLKYKVLPNSISISCDHPAFTFLEEGVRPHVMVYARNKVIPIELSKARNVTAADIRRGVALRTTGDNPQHPGYPALHFVQRGIARARKRVIEELQKELLVRATS